MKNGRNCNTISTIDQQFNSLIQYLVINDNVKIDLISCTIYVHIPFFIKFVNNIINQYTLNMINYRLNNAKNLILDKNLTIFVIVFF